MRISDIICGCLVCGLAVGCEKQQAAKAPDSGAEWSATKRQPREQPTAVNDVPESNERTTITMHRLRTGEPDEEGWCFAESSEGGFSVKLPTLFNDFTMSWKTADGGVAQMHIVGTKTRAGTAYSITGGTSTDVKVDSDFLEGFGKAFERGAKEKQPVTHAGMKGIHLRLVNPDSTGFARAFQHGRMRYVLMVDHQADSVLPPNVEQDAFTFFESFRLK